MNAALSFLGGFGLAGMIVVCAAINLAKKADAAMRRFWYGER